MTASNLAIDAPATVGAVSAHPGQHRTGPGRAVTAACPPVPEIRHGAGPGDQSQPHLGAAARPAQRHGAGAAERRAKPGAALQNQRGLAEQQRASFWPGPAPEGRHDPGGRRHPGSPRDLGMGAGALACSSAAVADSVQRAREHQPGRWVAGRWGRRVGRSPTI